MAAPVQRSCRTGEVSPRLYARADIRAYVEGLRACRNATVLPMGGVLSRPGTEYLGASKGNAQAYLIPFERDSDQEYLIEAGAGYFRFWLAGVQVTVGTPAAWLTATAYTAGVSRAHGGANYICILAHTSGGTSEPGVGVNTATYWYLLTTNILELPTPYTLADVPGVQWTDDGTTRRFFSHLSYPMRELIRISATAWSFLVTAYSASGAVTAPTNLAVTGVSGVGTGPPFFTAYKVTAVAGALESAASNIDGWNKRPGPFNVGNQSPLTMTWDAVAGAYAYNIYSSWSDQVFQFKAQVTTNGYVDELPWNGGGGSAPNTDVGLSDFTLATQYPGGVIAHQQRLIVFGQSAAPDVVYASRVASMGNFFPHIPIQDDDAMSWRQVASRINRVRYAAEVEGRLVLFADKTEGVVVGGGDGILRPGEPNPQIISHNGIAALPPLAVDTALLYVQARGTKVRDLVPSTAAGSDLSLTASHLLRGKSIVAWCFQQTPDPVVWMVLNDGAMLSLTYERASGTVGWARHDMDGVVEATACLPYSGRDAVHVFVKRTINAATVRYLERMTDRTAAWPNTICVDSAAVAV